MLSAAISSLLSGAGAISGPVVNERNTHHKPSPRKALVNALATEHVMSGLAQRILNRQEMQEFGGANWRVAEIANLCAHR